MDPEVSIVIPMYNEEDIILELYRRIVNIMQLWPIEIIFVDDGSVDRSRSLLNQLAEKDGRVKIVGLSRNFGHEIATTAGLHYASGEAVILMDADLQDPPELIPVMMNLWKNGQYEVVYGIRQERKGEGWMKKTTSTLFYYVLNRISGIPIPRNVGDFRLMSRSVVDAMNQMPERRRFVRGMVAWTGFRQIGIPYVREARLQGQTKYSMRKLLHLSVEAIVAFSERPLKLGTRLGFCGAMFGFIYAGWIVSQKIAHPRSIIPGWASVIVTVLIMGGANLFVLGVIGEYIGRILDEVRGRPLYLVDQLANFNEADHTRSTSVHMARRQL